MTTHDTWGIPGPQFLAVYLGLAVAVLVFGVIRLVLANRGRDGGGPTPTAQQLAFLNGGADNAVAASLAWLHGAGALTRGPDGTIARSGALPIGSTSLDSAIMQAAAVPLRVFSLRGQPPVQAALRDLEDSLVHDGLLPAPDVRQATSVAPVLLGVLFVLGVVRAAVGSANGKPVGYLVACLVGVVVATIGLLAARPRLTRRGRQALTSARFHHDHLHPRHSPAWATYGPEGAALAVGLFGAGVLWNIDPLLGAQSGMDRALRATASGTSTSSCSSGCSSSSCSSSSCGSSGCGGGGCGG